VHWHDDGVNTGNQNEYVMKKLSLFVLLILFGASVRAGGPVEHLDKKNISQMTVQEHNQRVQVLENRVKEINEIPLTSVSKSQKKDLKSELRYINKELKMHQEAYGIYISGSALLLIIILIILL
jgi:hypothetical protein